MSFGYPFDTNFTFDNNRHVHNMHGWPPMQTSQNWGDDVWGVSNSSYSSTSSDSDSKSASSSESESASLSSSASSSSSSSSNSKSANKEFDWSRSKKPKAFLRKNPFNALNGKHNGAYEELFLKVYERTLYSKDLSAKDAYEDVREGYKKAKGYTGTTWKGEKESQKWKNYQSRSLRQFELGVGLLEENNILLKYDRKKHSYSIQVDILDENLKKSKKKIKISKSEFKGLIKAIDSYSESFFKRVRSNFKNSERKEKKYLKKITGKIDAICRRKGERIHKSVSDGILDFSHSDKAQSLIKERGGSRKLRSLKRKLSNLRCSCPSKDDFASYTFSSIDYSDSRGNSRS